MIKETWSVEKKAPLATPARFTRCHPHTICSRH